MRGHRFIARFATALVITALLLFAHARYHVPLLLAVLGAGLATWAFFETRHTMRHRHD